MILLSLQDIRKHYGAEPVLRSVTFDVRPGERVSLVGPNGAGKTTLFRIIAGQEEFDSGKVELHSSAVLGFLEQHPHFEAGRTVWEEAKTALSRWIQMSDEAEQLGRRIADANDDAQRRRLGEQFDRLQHLLQQHDAYHLDHKIERVLTGLGFSSDELQQHAAVLSGGQQNRLLLAKLLLAEPDLMLLDEPSNHLDIEATQWLEDYLSQSTQTLLIVSHDRYFLDKVSNRTLELFHGEVESFAGNFSAYWKQKAERLEVQRRTYEKQQIEIAKMEDFVRRNHYGQKHTQAEDRRKKLERIERVPPPREIPAPRMKFPASARCGDLAVRIEHLSKAYDRPLFSDLTFDILRGQRWGILGPNGCGKTTFLRCLLGQTPPDNGRVVLGAGVTIGYFDQLLACLSDDATLVDAIRPTHKEFVEQQRRDLLARFGLTGDMVFQRIKELSGGERNRAALAMLSASDANLLVLDEPTNHLDLWARSALEKAIKEFDGTVLFVSHDRYFLNQVADHLLVMGDGGFRVIEGDYETYLHLAQLSDAPFVGASSNGAASPTTRDPSATTTEQKRRREKSPRRKRKFPYRKVDDLEDEIHTCETRLEQLHASLADPQFLRDGDRVKGAKADLEQTQQTLANLIEHWEEACEFN